MLSPRGSLLLALVIGAVATMMVRGLVLSQSGIGDTVAGSTIVVTRSPVAFGEPLTAENLREVRWSSPEALNGSFRTVAELLKDGRRLALSSMQSNEPILSARVTTPNGRAALSTQIEDGMRAVTVRVDEVRGVAGFVLPGDRVDIILTRGEGGSDGAAFADILLQNTRVLAIDQLVDERQDKPSVARAVTLELSVADAQKVVLAQGIGRLSLTLRQNRDSEMAGAGRVTVSDLGGEGSAARDRVAEFEKQLSEMKARAEAERLQSERNAAERLAEAEARLRGELTHAPVIAPMAVPMSTPAPNSRITVTRNGSRSETYSVTSER